jgi:hypothetical protein
MIFLFGASAIWLVSRKENWKKWGYILGLLAQPFWLYSTFTDKQWGMFCLSLFYTYSWIQGIYNYWIKK